MERRPAGRQGRRQTAATMPAKEQIARPLAGQSGWQPEIENPVPRSGAATFSTSDIRTPGTRKTAMSHLLIASSRPLGNARMTERRHHVDRRLCEHADPEQRRVGGGLRDVQDPAKPQEDQQHPEAIGRTAMAPVEPDADRAEDEVGFLGCEPTRILQERGGERDPNGGHSRDATDTNTANSSRRVSDARRGRPFSASARPRGPSSCASEVVPLVIGPEEAIVG